MAPATDPLRDALRLHASQSAGEEEPRCRILLALLNTSSRIQTLLRHSLSQQKLTETGFKILSVLSSHDPLPLAPTRLAALAVMWPPTVTDVLTRLELSGLIARERSQQDRRQVLARLTPAGHKKYTAAVAHVLDTMIEMMEPLDSSHLTALRAACDTLDARTARLAESSNTRLTPASA
ncbi:transcriptional regulator [Opitutaceae bacterium TAV1]|nr:transcriptional regulator [Opitutaceae bacterium TAV1]